MMMRILSVTLLSLAFAAAFGLPASPDNSSDPKYALWSCGVPRVRVDDDRIVGGRDAKEGEHNYMVSLQYRPSLNYRPQHICGASVVKECWILTAAHCVEWLRPSNVVVKLGITSLSENTKYTHVSDVSEIRVHEGFNPYTLENDVALMRMEKCVDFRKSNGYINKICLPPRTENTRSIIATGWGATEEGGGGIDRMQVVIIPLVPRTVCEGIYGKDSIAPSMICAGAPEGGKDTCQGDSGGPVVYWYRGRLHQHGIVSWGYGCARKGYPGVYTSVSYFTSWINSHIN